MTPEFTDITHQVNLYYTRKVESHGATARGVDWNSTESQMLRFEQLEKLLPSREHFSINDYGCGYGALAMYLHTRQYDYAYYGFDISERMIEEARRLNSATPHCQFMSKESDLPVADYTLLSGIFNVKMDNTTTRLQKYVLYTLDKVNKISRKGFAFNALTIYADVDKMRADLYYADPMFIFDYCKRTFSKYIAVLHDYPLYEFTIIVRK